MRKDNFNVKKFFTNCLITFASIFTCLILVFSVVSEFIYSNYLYLKDLIVISVVSIVSSLILMLFFRIKKITIVTQVLIVYSFFAIIIVGLGYYMFIYDFVYNIKLLLSTILVLILGAVLLGIFFFVKIKRSNKSLNDHLQSFKERDN